MKKLRKDILGYAKASVTTSALTSVAPEVGGIATSLPTVGTAIGAGATIRMLKKLKG